MQSAREVQKEVLDPQELALQVAVSVPVATGTELGSTAEPEVSYLLSHPPKILRVLFRMRILKFKMAHVQRNMPGFSRNIGLFGIWSCILSLW